MRHYLVVANLTLGGPRLWQEVRARTDAGPCHFHVVVPASHDPLAGAWTEADARKEAAARLDKALAALEDLGAQASGEVGDVRAVDAVLDALRARDYDEVIVSTLPPNVSRWMRMDLVSRIRRAVDVPVVHVVGQAEFARHSIE